MFAVRRELRRIVNQARNVHTNDSLINNITEVVNKNPRNLELLRIARKPMGFQLDVLNLEFWHKLEIKKYQRHVVAEVVHFEKGVVLSASSKEGGLLKQLYSLTDTNAYACLGSMIGKRCLESGIYEVRCDLEAADSERIRLFLKSVEETGLKLQESPVYRHPLPQTRQREEKPWEVYD